MPLPETIYPNGQETTVYGRMVEVVPHPAQLFARHEFQIAEDSGGPDWGNAESRELPAGQYTLVWTWPNDNSVRYFRVRAVSPGYTASSFVEDTTGYLPVPILGKKFDPQLTVALQESKRQLATLYFADGTIKAGTKIVDTGTLEVVDSAGAASALTKSLVIPGAEMLPESHTETWLFDAFLQPGSTGAVQTFRASVVLPPGVTVVGTEARMYRNAVGDTAQAALLRVSDTGIPTTLASMLHSSTGWQSVTDTLSEVVSDGLTYYVEVNLESTSSIDDARFLHFKITYEMPSYDKAL